MLQVQTAILLSGQRLGAAPTPHEAPQEEDSPETQGTHSHQATTATTTTTTSLHQQQQCIQIANQQYWFLTAESPQGDCRRRQDVPSLSEQGKSRPTQGQLGQPHFRYQESHFRYQEQLTPQPEGDGQVRQDLRREAAQSPLMCCIIWVPTLPPVASYFAVFHLQHRHLPQQHLNNESPKL